MYFWFPVLLNVLVFSWDLDYARRVKNMTIKVPDDVQRRFTAWCKLHGLSIQEVIVQFMREKSDQLAAFEDKTQIRKPED